MLSGLEWGRGKGNRKREEEGEKLGNERREEKVREKERERKREAEREGSGVLVVVGVGGECGVPFVCCMFILPFRET